MEKVTINIVLLVQVVALNSLWALCMSRSNNTVIIAWNKRKTKISFPGAGRVWARPTFLSLHSWPESREDGQRSLEKRLASNCVFTAN